MWKLKFWIFKTAPENREFICVLSVTLSFKNAIEFPPEFDGIDGAGI